MARPSLHVGLLSSPWVAVPPPAYGGTELMIDQLARRLEVAGHTVTLFATGDSTVPVPTAHCVATAVQDRIGEGAVELRHVMEATTGPGLGGGLGVRTLATDMGAEVGGLPEGVRLIRSGRRMGTAGPDPVSSTGF